MDYNLFEEVLKGLCYYDPCGDDAPSGTADKECRNANSDIPGGFQDIPPQLFIVIGEVLGNAIAGKLPFNVQNALGNWLELVGQAILTANAQQQYFMNGPGRFYNPIYRNSGNPFCPSSGTTSDDDSNVTPKSSESSKNTEKKSSSKSKKKTDSIANSDEIGEQINELRNEIEMLKEEIKSLKGKV